MRSSFSCQRLRKWPAAANRRLNRLQPALWATSAIFLNTLLTTSEHHSAKMLAGLLAMLGALWMGQAIHLDYVIAKKEHTVSIMKRHILLAALVGLLALAMAGCSAATPAPATGAAAQQATAPAVAQPEPTAVVETPAGQEAAVSATEAPAVQEASTKLNLNEASAADYQATIPGFSSRMAREFLEYRPYVSIQQFRREIGKYVDAAQVAEYEKYVYVPVDVDQSDAATLMQLPGVDESVAAALIAARPFGSNQAFLARLAELVAADDAGQAAAYLATP